MSDESRSVQRRKALQRGEPMPTFDRSDAEYIARRLRQARQEAGWSQARLGEVLGISHAAVSDMERGVSRIYALDLARMAEALDKPIKWFYPEGGDARELPKRSGSETSAHCYDCGLSYGGESWADLCLHDDDWRAISPTGGEGGLLCANCMVRRAKEIGLTHVRAVWASGPFSAPSTPRLAVLEEIADVLRDGPHWRLAYEALRLRDEIGDHEP